MKQEMRLVDKKKREVCQRPLPFVFTLIGLHTWSSAVSLSVWCSACVLPLVYVTPFS